MATQQIKPKPVARPKLDLDYFELVVVYNALTENTDYMSVVCEHLDSKLFKDDDINSVLRVVLDYYEQHDKVPSQSEIKARLSTAELRTSFKQVVNRFRGEITGKFGLEELVLNTEQFIKDRMVENCLVEAIADQAANRQIDLAKTQEALDSASALCLTDSLGHDYFDKIDEHCKQLQETSEYISTGWKWLDDKLGGGWMKDGRALYVFSGITNVGKSIFLGNVACNALAQGKTVVLVTLEMSEHVYATRIDAHLSQIAIRDLPNQTDQLASFLRNYKEEKKSKLIIKEYPPSSLTPRSLSAYLKKLVRRGVRPDLVVLDYLSLLEPNRRNDSSYQDVKKITEQIRALSYIYKCPFISATQLNRDAYGVENPGLETTSESMGLSHTVDAQFAIWRGEEDAELNIIRLGIMKNRFGLNTGSTTLHVNYDTLTLSEERDTSITPGDIKDLLNTFTPDKNNAIAGLLDELSKP